ncbi:unnamed protein product [Urochloa humidicola]
MAVAVSLFQQLMGVIVIAFFLPRPVPDGRVRQQRRALMGAVILGSTLVSAAARCSSREGSSW